MSRKPLLGFAFAAVIGLACAESAQAQVNIQFGGGRGGYGGGYYGGGYYGGYYPSYGYGLGYRPSYYSSWGYRPYGGYYGYGGPSYSYYPSYSTYYYGSPYGGYSSQPYSTFRVQTPHAAVTSTTTAAAPDQHQSFYRGPSPTASTQARIRIEVPTNDAQLWLEGASTEQKGVSRSFISPPLEAGAQYVYTVRASWMEGGQEVTREKTVNVRAGEEATLSFR